MKHPGFEIIFESTFFLREGGKGKDVYEKEDKQDHVK